MKNIGKVLVVTAMMAVAAATSGASPQCEPRSDALLPWEKGELGIQLMNVRLSGQEQIVVAAVPAKEKPRGRGAVAITDLAAWDEADAKPDEKLKRQFERKVTVVRYGNHEIYGRLPGSADKLQVSRVSSDARVIVTAPRRLKDGSLHFWCQKRKAWISVADVLKYAARPAPAIEGLVIRDFNDREGQYRFIVVSWPLDDLEEADCG